MKVENILFFFYIIFPFFLSPYVQHGSIIPKLFLAGVISVFLSLIAFYNVFYKGKIRNNYIFYFLLYIGILSIASAFFSDYRLLSLSNTLYIFMFAVSALGLSYFKEKTDYFLNLFSVQGGLLSLISIIQKLLGYKPLSTIGNTNWLASTLVFLFFINFKFIENYKLFGLINAILILLGIFISISRAALISLILCIGVMLFIKKRRIFFMYVLFVISVSFFICPYILTKFSVSSINYRLMLWKIAVLNFKESPILGNGLGTFSNKAMYLQTKIGKMFDGYISFRTNITHAHNEVLELISDLGILGLIIGIFAVIRIFKVINRDYILIALLGVFITSLFGFDFHVPLPGFYVFTVISLFLSHDKTIYKKNSKRIYFYISLLVFLLVFLRFVLNPFIAQFYLYSAKNLKESSYFYNKVLKLDPLNPDGYIGMAHFWHLKGEYIRSNEYLKRALNFRVSRDIYYIMGMNYYFMNNLLKALENLKMAAMFENKRFLKARLAFLTLAIKLKIWDDIKWVMHEIKTIDPDNEIIKRVEGMLNEGKL